MRRTEQSATWTKAKPVPAPRYNFWDCEAEDLAESYGPRLAVLFQTPTTFAATDAPMRIGGSSN